MRLLGKMYDNCYAVMSQTMTAIINRETKAQPLYLLTRVSYSKMYVHKGLVLLAFYIVLIFNLKLIASNMP